MVRSTLFYAIFSDVVLDLGPWSLRSSRTESEVLGLGLGLETQVLGLDLGLETKVLGLVLGLETQVLAKWQGPRTCVKDL